MFPSPNVGDTDSSNSHPLSPDQITFGRGRARHAVDNIETRPATSYFTLKTQAGRERSSGRSTISVTDAASGISAERSLHSLWDRSQNQSSPSAAHKTLPSTRKARTSADKERNDFGPVTNNQVLQTKWHELSDEQIQRTISRYSTPRGPSETPLKPYIAALRALSVGLHQSLRDQEELVQRFRTKKATIEGIVHNADEFDAHIGQRILDVLDDELDNTGAEGQPGVRFIVPHCLMNLNRTA